MKHKHIHIVSFDNPYPPNYGGVIDVFYKIKALKSLGIDVTLHCFVYNDRKPSDQLKNLCREVYYYHRDTSLFRHLSVLPYAVYSRKNKQLLENLLRDNDPILFEGLMSCYYLKNKKLRNRFKIFREANIEHDYYKELFKSSRDIKKKLYYLIESFKFKKYESVLSLAQLILAISKTDEKQLKERFPQKKVEFIPCFHSNDEVTSSVGISDFILYHGNLAVAENELAAVYLCTSVFSKLNCKCVIAGMKPSENLKNTAAIYRNVQLVANPDEETMNDLIKNAHINLLITFQPTGMKIKLLNALYAGKHIAANNAMLAGSGLQPLCHIADTSAQQIKICNELLSVPFDEKDILKRKETLTVQYNNVEQAKKILSFL